MLDLTIKPMLGLFQITVLLDHGETYADYGALINSVTLGLMSKADHHEMLKSMKCLDVPVIKPSGYIIPQMEGDLSTPRKPNWGIHIEHVPVTLLALMAKITEHETWNEDEKKAMHANAEAMLFRCGLGQDHIDMAYFEIRYYLGDPVYKPMRVRNEFADLGIVVPAYAYKKEEALHEHTDDNINDTP